MKQRSPRKKPMTSAWSYMVYSRAKIQSPDKKTRKLVQTLWFEGYSHKDAAMEIMKGFDLGGPSCQAG